MSSDGGWISGKLEDLMVLQRGFDITKANQEPGSIPVVSSSGINSYHSTAKVDGPGVITGRSGSLGRVIYVDEPYWPHNTTLWVKDFKGNNPRFVYYFLKSLQLERFDSGSSEPTLNRNHIHGMEITYPEDVAIQNRIVDIIENYDILIDNNCQQMQLLEEAARLLYQEWFVHLHFPGHEHITIHDGVPKGWKREQLSALCFDVRKSTEPKELHPDTPYIGLNHIPRRSITLNQWGTADEVKSDKLTFADGDILFCKIRPYFHKVGFALTDGITSSDTIVIRPINSSQYHYILFLLSSDEFVNLASKTVKEGSKMPRADWKFLLKTKFLVPPHTLLESFGHQVSPILSQLRNLVWQNRRLSEARDLLMPHLMSEEVTI